MRYALISLALLTAHCSSQNAHTAARTPAATTSAATASVSREDLEKVISEQEARAQDALAKEASKVDKVELSGKVSAQFASVRSRDGRSMSVNQQQKATESVVNLVEASQEKNLAGMSSAANGLVSVIQEFQSPQVKLVDGLGLAQAIQAVVAASLNADVQGILKAVADIVAAAMK